MSVLQTVRANARTRADERNKIADRLNAARVAGDTDAEAREVEALRAADAELDTFEARIAELEAEERGAERAAAMVAALGAAAAPAGGAPAGAESRAYDQVARVGSEPRTYTRATANEGVSFFRDLLISEKAGGWQARERLQRHSTEVRVEGEMTERAVSTGTLAGIVPPQYLVDQYALVARAGRPTANIVQHLPLPSEGMSVIIPRGTAGATTGVQALENSAVSNTDQAWGNVTAPVVTIAGQQVVSRQAIERAPIGTDAMIFADIAAAYAVNLDQQVLVGTGTGNQMLGILNTAGVNQASAFAAAATLQTFLSKVAGQINAVQTTRFLAPTAIVLHPRRWNWLTTQLDSSNRPLVVPTANGPMNAVGIFDKPHDTPSSDPVGEILGVPVITDASVPTAVGTGPEDQVIVARREDLILWEDGNGGPQTLTFEQTAGASLSVTLVAYGYAAFTAGRYPTAVGIVGGNAGAAGNGLVAPTF